MATLLQSWSKFSFAQASLFVTCFSPNSGFFIVLRYSTLCAWRWIRIVLDACTEKVVTYTELQDKVVRCALWLRKQGIKPGDVVSVCTHSHLNSIVPCLAAIYINAIFNPWDDSMDLQTSLHVMQLTTPKVIFCNEKVVNVILKATKENCFNPNIVVFGDYPDAIAFSDILSMYSDAEAANFQFFEPDNIKQTVCIIHTSGSTGMPKGVELSNYALLISIENRMLNATSTVLLWFSPLHWIGGIVMNLKSIVQGYKVIIYPKFEEEMTCRLIKKYEVKILYIISNLLNQFLKAGYVKNYSLSSLKVIILAGAALRPKVQEEMRRILPNVLMLQSYGMTEICGSGTLQFPNHKTGSCGTVMGYMEMKIVDPKNGEILSSNNSGELWIKTPTMMTCYYKNPKATKSIIDEEGWLHSGDIGYFDEDGELFIVDRMNEFIKYRSYQISPGEIEDILVTHPAVIQAAVVGVPHPVDGEHPVGFVTKIPDEKVTEQELIEFVLNNMKNQYKLLAKIIFLDAFPYTGSKIAKTELKRKLEICQ
ncbi:4-coumarate--CoA ligase 1-like isoform X2 [Nylanderia fulva]|uniref:4-coumarate--CoA ligase 1-like isoform X2 n=1 Tax=Nylanderia fulva TaxID=613905 RepID=UPI0010FAE5E4|nr:4-coumarate--CoA ligase 1-like isoform X2 [Nylanderia fulva]